ncbi:hypothetical protein FBU30_007525 [Linnemannia zychae]|nr:hypothetical protein FBU30_007525 [Linnemannia zychae]
MTQSPVAAFDMGYITIDENTFYLLGGVEIAERNLTHEDARQFYSLDLTTNWDTSNPSWKALPYPSPNTPPSIWRYNVFMTATLDSHVFTMWSFTPGRAFNFNISDGLCTQAPVPTSLSGWGTFGAANPETGEVFILGATIEHDSITRVNPMTGSSNTMALPQNLVSNLPYNGFAWCQPRKSFLHLTNPLKSGSVLHEYIPSTNKWDPLNSGGQIPTFRNDACLIPAYNGTKMVLFGGDTAEGYGWGKLSVLDIATMTWVTYSDSPEIRLGVACSVSGDYFIVWGGMKMTRDPQEVATPLVFNIHTGLWTTQFVGSVTKPTKQTGSMDDTKSNTAAIAGGIAGAVVLLAILAIVFVRKKQQRQAISNQKLDATLEEENYKDLPSLVHSYNDPRVPHHVSQPIPNNQLSPGIIITPLVATP